MKTKNITLFSWIRNQHNAIALFIGLFTNLMAFSQPLHNALASQNQMHFNLGSSYSNGTGSVTNALAINAEKESVTNPIKKTVTKTISTNATVVDASIIFAVEKQGIIGKSENLPIDELTDNIFSFELKQDIKQDKDAYLEYELFGLADGSQVTKNINDELAIGGSLIKTTKGWTKVKEKLNPSDLKKGKNTIQFTTLENAKYQYMVRNLKMVYEDKTTTNNDIIFHQNEANSYDGKVFFTGYVTDKSIQKVIVLEKEYPVVKGVFEVLLEEKAPNANIQVGYTDAKGSIKTNSIKIKELLEKPTEVHKSLKSYPFASKLFIKARANNLSFGGAKLVVDSLALTETKNISITGLRYEDLPTLSPEMVNVTAAYNGYKMLPHGNHFATKPAKIHLKYDESKLPTGYTSKDIKTFYFDSNQKKWMALEKDTLLLNDKEIVSKTTHFTDFINGIIKVPESPETGSYTPTSIKDIKAADPTAGVVSIAPPTPNNMGTLNTSFPIKLPAGRSGMQPSLSVNYSSEGGNGWMGLGWDLSIPGVSLDTRWGAPRYGDVDGNGSFDNKETEIYSMGGGMLTLKDGSGTTAKFTNPNRTDDINAQPDRQFYPRIEGSYAQIIRHGNNPTNYWWEVTDKMGNKSLYGNADGSPAAMTAELKTNTGNISYWGLYRTLDTNGNYVEYTYENRQVQNMSGQPGDGGKEFYIKEIRYTLKNGETPTNYYKVDFVKDTDPNQTPINRSDVQINARNGVVQVTKNLLTEVKIGLFQNGTLLPIRSYRYFYEDGVFYKKLLKKISEYDASGDLFYSNVLDYETKGDDKVTTVSNSNFFGANNDDWNNGGSDGLSGDLIVGQALSNVSNEFSNKGSILGSSEDGGGDFGGYVGFGPPCPWSKRFTAGINFGGGFSSGGGLSSFMDINGDGLPDKVFRKNGSLNFRPNIGSGFGSLATISNINNISRSSSSNWYVGVQASFGVFAGITYNNSESSTSTYFSDVNGDGMPDLVDGGLVRFNQAINNNYRSTVDFSPANHSTSNPVGAGSVSQVIVNSVKVKTLTQLEDENPQHDIVKIWIAKRQGIVNISGSASIVPLPATTQAPYPTSTDQYFNDYDGVRLSIQLNGGANSVKLENTLQPTFTASATVNNAVQNMSYSNLSVNVGDRIFFRMQSRKEGSYDRVQWNPNVQYTGTDELDANGLSYFSSPASEGFILSDNVLLNTASAGTVTFSWPSTTAITTPNSLSDNLIFKIEQGIVDATGFVVNTVYTAQYDSLLGGLIIPSSFSPPLPTSVLDDTIFKFSVSSQSNLDWKLVNWKPRISKTPVSGPQITYFGVVEYQIFNKKINSDVISKITGINPSLPLVVKPVINQAFITTSGLSDGSYQIKLVIKNNLKKVIAQKIISIFKTGSFVNIPPIDLENLDITSDITSTIFVEYYSDNINIANLASNISEPIKAEVYQANANPTPAQLSSAPPVTNVINASFFLSEINFQTLHDTALTSQPYYEDKKLTTNNPNLIKTQNYTFNIVLDTSTGQFPSKRAAVWIDFNRNGIVDTTAPNNEFFPSTTATDNHNITINIPTSTTDGNVYIRVRGGSNIPYSALTFNNQNIQGTVRDYQVNIVSYTNKFSKDLYCKVGNDKFGTNYRGWGQFAYHGGIVVKRDWLDLNGDGIHQQNEYNQVILDANGQPIIDDRYGETAAGVIIPIDEIFLDEQNVNPAVQSCGNLYTPGSAAFNTCLQNVPPTLGSSIRFFRLKPNPEYDTLFGSSLGVNVEENFFSSSRYGVKNIKTIFTEFAPPPVSMPVCGYQNVGGVSLISRGEGYSSSGGFGPVSGNYSTSFNWTELSYMDLNGDRYPDLLTKDNVQFTNSLGGLAETKSIPFGRPSTGNSENFGASASGTFLKADAEKPKPASTTATASQGTSPKGSSRPSPQVKSSAGLSGGGSTGNNKDTLLWIDMNGDGLPDRVNVDRDIKVSLNLGYNIDYANEKVWISQEELRSSSSNFNGGAGFSIEDNSYSFGVSVSASKSFTERNISDINGDGLPDFLIDGSGGNFSYRLNTGNGFIGPDYGNSGYINYSRSTAEGVNGAFSIPVCFFFFGMTFSGHGGADQSLTRTENSLEDINGDGYVDILSSGAGGNNVNDGELHARLSNIGTTNYLKTVTTPTGGSWTVAFKKQAESNTFDMPQNKYVMSTISTFDGFTADNNWSQDRTVTSIEYSKPYYDRREREFYGYEKVKVNQHESYNTAIDIHVINPTLPTVYRYSEQEFFNNNYYLKGAVKKETLFDAAGTVWTENLTTYGIYRRDLALNLSQTLPLTLTSCTSLTPLFTDTTYNLTCLDVTNVKYGANVTFKAVAPITGVVCTDLDASSLFVTPLVSIKRFTEGDAIGSNNKLSVTRMEEFDATGNVRQYRDYGEQTTDVYVSKIDYFSSIAGITNSSGYPKTIQVFQSNGTTLQRERKATYYPATGNLETVTTKLNATEDATVKMTYDTYGNLSRVSHENSINPNSTVNNGRFFRDYTYDPVLHTYPTRVDDAFGYFSTSEYSYLFGVPVYTTDMNLQPMRTRIDDRGRPIEITGPYELFVEGVSGGSDIGWTIRFEYQGEAAVATKVASASIDDDNRTAIYPANYGFDATTSSSLVAAGTPHHALTRHFDPEYRTGGDDSVLTNNQILTTTLSDGFGKPVQVKKMFAEHLAATSGSTPNAANNTLKWLLPGKVKTDAFGRAIQSYYPTTQTDNFAGLSLVGGASFIPANSYTYNNAVDTVTPTETGDYDVLDRPHTTKLPGETDQTTMDYNIDNNRFVTVVTNELGQVQKSYTDVRGRTTQTLQESVTGNIATTFDYNNISELMKVTDVANNITESQYDLAGRRIELHHPDNGVTKFTYDRASNLTKRETANLLNTSQSIDYKYTYNRLDEIKYPQNPENNVNYYYGTAGNADAANNNAVGRLWYHVDATGTQYFEYGKLGELTKNRRSVAVPGDRVYWFQTEWTYDTWNRVKTIKYPDEELVTYKYNKGGELHAMTSEKNLLPNKDIISQLGYDKFGQRTYLRYGNGTETTYNYEAERRRLNRMKVASSTLAYGLSNAPTPSSVTIPNRTFVDNRYEYDALSNVKAIRNNLVTMPTATQIGGRSWQEFGYDDLNRLTTATGNFVGRNENGVGYNHNKYTLGMSYDSQHNISNKTQRHETASSASVTTAGTWTDVEKSSYTLDYQDYNAADYTVAGFNYKQPHAPRKIIDQPVGAGVSNAATDPRIKTLDYEYDRNGNQTKVSKTTCDAPVAEVTRENLWDEENRLKAIDLNPEADAVHPIAIYTYDAGGERIIKQNSTSVAVYENAEKVGTTTKSDFMLYPSGMLVARLAADGTGALSYTKHYFAGSQRVSSKIGTTTNLGKFLDEWTLQSTSSSPTPINPVLTSNNQLTKAEAAVTKVYTAFAITPAPTFASNTAFTPVPAFTATGLETEQYFFHPDHLGSSNYITNFVGEVSQHMEYFAFGETFIEEHKNSHNSPYKYNGKELDEESGLYYYGARYYDPRISIWASVDPLAEQTPNWSPYAFCNNNPVRYNDPTGMSTEDPGDIYNLLGQHIGNDGINDNKVYLNRTFDNTQLTQSQSKSLTQNLNSPFSFSTVMVSEVKITNDELNLRSSLSTLKQTEAGRVNAPLDYNTWNNNKNFTEDSYTKNPEAYSAHPGTNTDSGGSAAGAYQFLDRFYKGSDFSPQNQDKAAVNNMTSSSYQAAKSGNMTDFKSTTQARWTSLKHWEVPQLQNTFNSYRSMELLGNSPIATPVGQLLKK